MICQRYCARLFGRAHYLQGWIRCHSNAISMSYHKNAVDDCVHGVLRPLRSGQAQSPVRKRSRPRLHRPGAQLCVPVEIYRYSLCHALAGSPRGGNGFVLAGVVAVTAPSWWVNCGRGRRSRRGLVERHKVFCFASYFNVRFSGSGVTRMRLLSTTHIDRSKVVGGTFCNTFSSKSHISASE